MERRRIIENKYQDYETPIWLDNDYKIVEPEFCDDFLVKHQLCCINGRFFTVDGPVGDEAELKQQIYAEISPWLTYKVAKKTDELFNALRIAAYSPPLPLQDDRIHVANGTLYLSGLFDTEKEFCRNRLTVSYNPNAPKPERWLRFLGELLEDEDIPTLQEYLGYCLLPTTKAQKMLMLIGKGGEGKSRIGVVLRSVFGDAMNTTNIPKVENNRFARADLENKLLMVDDDMDLSALQRTSYIKSIITSEGKMDMERKGVQSYQSQLYVRFLCFGNGALTSLHDRSDGFFRRQIVLTVKDKPADRPDDPFLAEKLIGEREGICLWMLEGLKRLIANDYRFTVSERARENVRASVREANNVTDFLASQGYVRIKADYEASTRNLYAAYKTWCEDNAEAPLSTRSFSTILAQQAPSLNLEPTNNVYLCQNKRCRGYIGIEVLERPTLL